MRRDRCSGTPIISHFSQPDREQDAQTHHDNRLSHLQKESPLRLVCVTMRSLRRLSNGAPPAPLISNRKAEGPRWPLDSRPEPLSAHSCSASSRDLNVQLLRISISHRMLALPRCDRMHALAAMLFRRDGVVTWGLLLAWTAMANSNRGPGIRQSTARVPPDAPVYTPEKGERREKESTGLNIMGPAISSSRLCPAGVTVRRLSKSGSSIRWGVKDHEKARIPLRDRIPSPNCDSLVLVKRHTRRIWRCTTSIRSTWEFLRFVPHIPSGFRIWGVFCHHIQ
jgi:ribosomal protein L37AE/L43A